MLGRMMLQHINVGCARRTPRQWRDRIDVAISGYTGVVSHWRYSLRMRWYLTMQSTALQVRLHREHVFLPVPVQLAVLFCYLSTSRKSTKHADGMSRSNR